MENPATWPPAAKIIEAAINKFHKTLIPPIVYGKSLIMTIHDDLVAAGYIKDINETDNNNNSL